MTATRTDQPDALASWASATTVGDVLLRAAARTPESIVLAMPGCSWTYAELAAAARRVARNLIGVGSVPGDRIAVLMQNGFENAQRNAGGRALRRCDRADQCPIARESSDSSSLAPARRS
jgi:acyl-CoA synthetase (AMP-forming)/AMP-acid ligase II